MAVSSPPMSLSLDGNQSCYGRTPALTPTAPDSLVGTASQDHLIISKPPPSHRLFSIKRWSRWPESLRPIEPRQPYRTSRV